MGYVRRKGEGESGYVPRADTGKGRQGAPHLVGHRGSVDVDSDIYRESCGLYKTRTRGDAVVGRGRGEKGGRRRSLGVSQSRRRTELCGLHAAPSGYGWREECLAFFFSSIRCRGGAVCARSSRGAHPSHATRWEGGVATPQPLRNAESERVFVYACVESATAPVLRPLTAIHAAVSHDAATLTLHDFVAVSS